MTDVRSMTSDCVFGLGDDLETIVAYDDRLGGAATCQRSTHAGSDLITGICAVRDYATGRVIRGSG